MTITENRNGDSLTIALKGRLDTVSAPELEAALQKVLPGVEKLVFDFTKLEYVSSAGLRLMLFAHKAMSDKQGMAIRGVNELIREVFEVSGFTDILNIE